MAVCIGYDIGTISLKRVIVQNNKIIEIFPYIRHHGKFLDIILEDLNTLSKSFSAVDGLAFTGSGGKQPAKILGAVFINEIEALITGVKYLYPDAKTIIEIGGEHSKFVDLQTNDFSMNELCAAGTGSFLDQQASRFNMSIEDFSSLALNAKKAAIVAGRCSVFAKSDMIHLQQEGTPDEEIALGLCYAVARSFKAGIAKGKNFVPPVVFCGGLAFNRAVIRALQDIGKEKLVIPEYPESVSALGAALASKSKIKKDTLFILSEIATILKKSSLNIHQEKENLPKLEILSSKLPEENTQNHIPDEKIKISIGIDVGSISTNVVAIDTDKNLVTKVYIRTAGRPIEAVKKGISILYEKLGTNMEVVACGTTGSGRYLTGDLVGADIVINEITAQARAAVHIDPEVDTIFEIGGQDSKYIYLQNGVIVDFEMNKICAAGTGSFLEEQSERFNIPIENFGRIALSAESPLDLGERCTVFMETNVYAHFQKGASIPDILAGLAYSIVANYLNRVVGRKKIGRKIFFQGAVAFNRAVVAAFEKVLNKPIIVPSHHEVTGAIGAAIVALENLPEKSKFRGFEEIINLNYQQSTFECGGCSNHCEIKRVSTAQSDTLFYGGRCEKYEVRASVQQKTPDLFAQRNALLFSDYCESGENSKNTLRIGIPRSMLTYEFFPFWNTFFRKLGFSVVLSDETNRKIINSGLEATAAETCFPIKVVLGHVQNLLSKNVDYIFIPVIRDMPCDYKKIDGTRRGSYTCPYVQAIATIVKSCLDVPSNLILDPVINFSFKHYSKRNQLVNLGKILGKNRSEILQAARSAEFAQKKFKETIKKEGKEILEKLPSDAVATVIIGRPYNCCDLMICMDIPVKLRNLGFWVLPLDYLPIEKFDIFEKWPNLYWEFGYRMMCALEIIKHDTRLYPVYITNFGCGPDSFLLQYFEREINKPFLKIEVDEHTAGAGIITRCEAFADSLKNYRRLQHIPFKNSEKKKLPVSKVHFSPSTRRKVFVPYMGDGSLIIKSVLRSLGIDTEVMYADRETLELGRKHTLGKECYPFIITTGDMLKTLKYNDPDKIAFFMPVRIVYFFEIIDINIT
ncbi:MAG: acyl-CoA dehydratase activase [bacterium]|nr:acyl-CoA dehydratase activase [bacterium]